SERRKFEVPHKQRPRCWRLRQERQRESMADVVIADCTIEFRVKIIFRCVWQIDGGGDINRLRPGVIRQHAVIVRKCLTQAESAGIVKRKTNRLYVEHKPESRIRKPWRCWQTNVWRRRGAVRRGISIAEIFFSAWQSWTVGLHVSWAISIDTGVNG